MDAATIFSLHQRFLGIYHRHLSFTKSVQSGIRTCSSKKQCPFYASLFILGLRFPTKQKQFSTLMEMFFLWRRAVCQRIHPTCSCTSSPCLHTNMSVWVTEEEASVAFIFCMQGCCCACVCVSVWVFSSSRMSSHGWGCCWEHEFWPRGVWHGLSESCDPDCWPLPPQQLAAGPRRVSGLPDAVVQPQFWPHRTR